MASLNTIEDFLQVVREDKEIRAAVRRELLTEELLALPQRISALTKSVEAYKEATDQRFDIVVNRLDRQDETYRQQKEDTDQRFDIVVSHLDRQDETYRQQKEDTDQQFGIVVNRLDRQHEMYRRQHDDLARFRGNYAIDAARNSDADIAVLFARLRGIRRIQIRRLGNDDLDAMLNDNLNAVEALRLRDRAWLTFPKSDIIAEVSDRRNAAPGFYIAIEASYTGDAEDFLRATDHAKILRHVTGQDAYAVVAGVRKGPSIESGVLDDIEEFVAANDQDTAFWYQLEENELEPPDPC